MKRAIFTGLVILAASYAYYDFQSDQKDEKRKSEQAILLPWNHAEIDSLKILRGEQNLEMKKENGQWQLVSPVQDRVSEEDITTFLEGLTTERSMSVVTDRERVDDKVFGLDSPLAQIIVQKGSELHTFQIGSKKNFQGNAYLRIDSDPRVVVASATWFNKADKTAYDFRDKRWARLNVQDLVTISLQAGKEKTELTKKGEEWVYKNHPTWKVDQSRIQPFLASLSDNRIQKFSVPLDSEKPFAWIKLGLKDGKKWEGQLFINAEKKHVLSVPAEKLTGEIMATEVDGFYKISEDSIRDRTAPFKLAQDQVTEIELATPAKNWSFKLVDNKWSMQPKLEGRDVDSSKMAGLLIDVGKMEVLQFTNKLEDKELNAKSSKVTFKNAEGKVLLQMRWGPVRRLTINGSSFEVAPLLTNLEPTVLLVAKQRIAVLDFEDIFLSKVAPKETP